MRSVFVYQTIYMHLFPLLHQMLANMFYVKNQWQLHVKKRQQMIEAASNNNKKLMIGHNQRFVSSHEKARATHCKWGTRKDL